MTPRKPPGRRLADTTVHLLRQLAVFGDQHQPASRFHGANLGERMRDLVNLGYLEFVVQQGLGRQRNCYRLAPKGWQALETYAHVPHQSFDPKPETGRRLCAGDGCEMADLCGLVRTPRGFDTVEVHLCPDGQRPHYQPTTEQPTNLSDASAVFAWPHPVRFIRQQQEWQGEALPRGPRSVWDIWQERRHEDETP